MHIINDNFFQFEQVLSVDFDWTLPFTIFGPDYLERSFRNEHNHHGKLDFETRCLQPILRDFSQLSPVENPPANVTVRPLKYEEEATKRAVHHWQYGSPRALEYQKDTIEKGLFFGAFVDGHLAGWICVRR